jgi:hypothetical protein
MTFTSALAAAAVLLLLLLVASSQAQSTLPKYKEWSAKGYVELRGHYAVMHRI